MRIRRLEVTNLAGIAAGTVDLGPGLNVLHGPNELGKSSLVNAIRAALLLQPGSSAAEALVDWHTDAPPTVSLTFEQETGRTWRIRKSFGSGRDAWSYLEFSKDGRDFTQEGKGREVDGTLQGLLRWGVEAPGGRGRRKRGIPESFITTALLGEQSDIVGVLSRSLADDPDESGRQLLTEALQAMGEDPLVKRILNSVQQKVDEAFTATGRRKSGQASPWVQLREERRVAERREAEVRDQLSESESARLRIGELHTELLDAQAEEDRCAQAVRRTATDLERKRARGQAAEVLRAAEQEVARIQAVLDARDAKAAAVEGARGEAESAEQARDAAERVLGVANARSEESRMRVRELEGGAAEQQRRLREQDAEKRLLEVDSKRTELLRRREQAERVGGLQDAAAQLRDEIHGLDEKLATARELLEKARDAFETDQDALEELSLRRHLARHLAASKRVTELKAQLEGLIASRRRAEELESTAADMRAEVAAMRAPAEEDIAQLRSLETDLRVAREKLSVRFVVTLTPEDYVDVEFNTDGKSAMRHLAAGTPTEIEVDRELRADLPGFGELHVRGGNLDLVREADAAQERWEAASAPIFAATNCRSVAELEALQQLARLRMGEAHATGQQAAELRVRSESVEDLERAAALAEAEASRTKAELQEMLAPEDEEDPKAKATSVDVYVAELDEDPADERAIEVEIDSLKARIRDREELRNRLEAQVSGERARLETQRAELAARERDLQREAAALDGSWEEVLEGTERELEGVEAQRATINDELASIRAEATSEVDGARTALLECMESVKRAADTLRSSKKQSEEARDKLSRLTGELAVLREASEREALEAATALVSERAVNLDALPAPEDEDVDEVALDEVQRAAADAQTRVRQLEAEMRRVEGALEHVGGQYIEEQADQAQDAIASINEREHALEVEYGAWQLLRETLAEAEKEDSIHLGNTLVEPVSQRMTALTQGRYGEIAIGPQLDVTGVQLGGGERQLESLSVGTQEQLALLIRLSIAEALSTFVILDDQLTQSDRERMGWMRELLKRAAEKIQIVVLTCHPEDYVADDGGEARVVDLLGCVRRSPVSGRAQARHAPATTAEKEPVRGGGSMVDATSDSSASDLRTVPRRQRRKRRSDEETMADLTEALRLSLKDKEK